MADKTYNLSLQLSDGSTINAGNIVIPGGGGGSSVQPDWAQNDPTAADYLKNRTHWIERGEVTIYEGATSDSGVSTENLMEEGKEYTVVFDGSVEYTETAQTLAYSGVPFVLIGNPGFFGGKDNGKTYLVATGSVQGQNMIAAIGYDSGGNLCSTVKVTGVSEVVHKIPEKYMPDSVFKPYLFHTVTSEMNGTEQLIIPNASELDKAMAESLAGKAVVLINGFVCDGFTEETWQGAPTIRANYSANPFSGIHLVDSALLGDSAKRYIVFLDPNPTAWKTSKPIAFEYSDQLELYLKATSMGLDISQGENGTPIKLSPATKEITFGDWVYEVNDDGSVRAKKSGAVGGTLYPLPTITAGDNGKVAGVVDGKPAWVEKGGTGEWYKIRTVTVPEDITTDMSGVNWTAMSNGGAVFGFDTDENGNPFEYKYLSLVTNIGTPATNLALSFFITNTSSAIYTYDSKVSVPLWLGKDNALKSGWAAMIPVADSFVLIGREKDGAGISTVKTSNISPVDYYSLFPAGVKTAIGVHIGNNGGYGFSPGSTIEFWGRM